MIDKETLWWFSFFQKSYTCVYKRTNFEYLIWKNKKISHPRLSSWTRQSAIFTYFFTNKWLENSFHQPVFKRSLRVYSGFIYLPSPKTTCRVIQTSKNIYGIIPKLTFNFTLVQTLLGRRWKNFCTHIFDNMMHSWLQFINTSAHHSFFLQFK